MTTILMIHIACIILIIQHAETGTRSNRKIFKYKSVRKGENSFFSDFRRFDKIKKFLIDKNKNNPELTELSNIGKSVEGRPIMMIKIGQGLTSKTKPIIYIDGGMHAREWAAITTALYIIEHLIADYANGDNQVKSLLKTYDFFVTPVINPDGYEYTHTKDRMWRKNRAKIKGSKCMGVDLNRNYPFHWGGKGSSHNPCAETYCGPSALSEPETQAVKKTVLAYKNRMKAYITLHSYGQYWFYPWGYKNGTSPNDKELKRVALIGHKALSAVHGTKYKIGPPGILYISQGSDDWAHGEAQIPYVYCLEMRDKTVAEGGRYGFKLPKSAIIPVGEETFAGIKAVAQAIIKTECKANVCKLVQ